MAFLQRISVVPHLLLIECTCRHKLGYTIGKIGASKERCRPMRKTCKILLFYHVVCLEEVAMWIVSLWRVRSIGCLWMEAEWNLNQLWSQLWGCLPLNSSCRKTADTEQFTAASPSVTSLTESSMVSDRHGLHPGGVHSAFVDHRDGGEGGGANSLDAQEPSTPILFYILYTRAFAQFN